MKFSDFICREAVRTHLEADEKEAVIRAMGKALVESGKIKEQDFEGIVAAILKREELGSTGIGRGVAVPHTKHPAVDKLVGTVAISDEGVTSTASTVKRYTCCSCSSLHPTGLAIICGRWKTSRGNSATTRSAAS
jgi:mannitol/fructose-specific phosphotransferase system IIA component (Ntr-type)